jgi:hypothetical protein
MTHKMSHGFKVDDIKNITLLRGGIAPEASIVACSEPIIAFESKISGLIKERIPDHLARGLSWREFRPHERNFIFPEVLSLSHIMQYGGGGQFYIYSLIRMRSHLFAENPKTIKQCNKIIDGTVYTDIVDIPDTDYSFNFEYNNGFKLFLNGYDKFVTWSRDDLTISSRSLQPDESTSGLLKALEQYCEYGVLDKQYALHLCQPLGLNPEVLSMHQRGQYLEESLGL